MLRIQNSLDRIAAWFVGKPMRALRSITLASICLLFAFLACTLGSTTEPPDQQPTVTSEADPTAEPPSDEPATPETPTPTESPWIEGSVERATYDPASGLGPPDVHDDFSGTKPEFELDNTSGVAHGWYQNGRFNITFPTRGWWTWYSGSTELTNFYVDVVVYNGDQCADRDAGGLLYRFQQLYDMGFLFGITCGGGYFSGYSEWPGATGPVCIFLNSVPTSMSDLDCSGLWTHPISEYIDSGPGAANRIGVRALGQQITLYINGHHVDSLILPPYITVSGKFALYLGAGQADDASVSFDDLSIWFNP
ncbi:MAG TPA: LamG domain-containing protein [Anaerolineae bacterium]|nr:LamG domain-containing protein [Anaerolineae bacterium]